MPLTILTFESLRQTCPTSPTCPYMGQAVCPRRSSSMDQAIRAAVHGTRCPITLRLFFLWTPKSLVNPKSRETLNPKPQALSPESKISINPNPKPQNLNPKKFARQLQTLSLYVCMYVHTYVCTYICIYVSMNKFRESKVSLVSSTHESVEDTELSTNKQHTLFNPKSH